MAERSIVIATHFMRNKWTTEIYVLQTRPHYESPSGVNIVEILKTAVIEWNLTRSNGILPVVTDNVAVKSVELSHHFFAYTINLASQYTLKMHIVNRLLSWVRIVSLFHSSSTETAKHVRAKQYKIHATVMRSLHK